MVEIRVVIRPKQEETKLYKMPDSFDIYESLFTDTDYDDVFEISDLLPKSCIYKPNIPGILSNNSDERELDRKKLKKISFISEDALKEIKIERLYESLLTKYKEGSMRIDSLNKIVWLTEEKIEYHIDEKIRPVWHSNEKVRTNQVCYFPSKNTMFQFFIKLSEMKVEKLKALSEMELCNGVFIIESINEITHLKSKRAILLSSYLPKDVSREIVIDKSFFRVKMDSKTGRKMISPGAYIIFNKISSKNDKAYYYYL